MRMQYHNVPVAPLLPRSWYVMAECNRGLIGEEGQQRYLRCVSRGGSPAAGASSS